MEEKKISWHALALMTFSFVWGFGNIINGFAKYGGLKAIVSWLIIFIIYFVPYSLMVGEMGSAFKHAGGGVSSWVNETFGAKLAYYAGWTYWIVHMPYISQKPSRVIIASSWIMYGDARISKGNVMLIQFASIAIFLIILYLASKGVNFVKRISSLAGTTIFVMSLLFILLALAAPYITAAQVPTFQLNKATLMPNFDANFFLNLSILVFAVGGSEKISPYVNKMKNPGKDFPKGMIALVVMVAFTAVIGTIALAMIFDPNNPPKDLLTNGSYYAFKKLGEYYGVGNLLMILYAVCELISQIAVITICVDAPLRILIESSDSRFIPKSLTVKNQHDAYINGMKLIGVIITILILIPAFGIKSVDSLVDWLVKLNSVCMPLRYLWVFFAYIGLKKAGEKFSAEYRFTNSKTFGYIMGGWCFFFTAAACILGIYSDDPFKLIMNIITPIVLVTLGLIMPYVAKKENGILPNTNKEA